MKIKISILLYISVVTIAEILDGIARLPNSKKKHDLKDWFYGEVHTRFMDQILNIDEHVAKMRAMLNASEKRHYCRSTGSLPGSMRKSQWICSCNLEY